MLCYVMLPAGVIVVGSEEGVAGGWVGESTGVVLDPGLDASDGLQQTQIAGASH